MMLLRQIAHGLAESGIARIPSATGKSFREDIVAEAADLIRLDRVLPDDNVEILV